MTHTASLEFLMGLQRLAAIVLLGGFALMLAAEWLRPAQGTAWDLRRLVHGGHNLLLWLLGIVAMSAVFGGMVWLLLQWMQFRRIGVLYYLPLPPWALAIAAFALLDAADYIFHRMSHNVRWLWLLHAVHHSDPRMDVTTNLRQHPFHLLATQAWKLLACAAIGVPAWVFLVHEILVLGFAHLHHAAVRWPAWIDPAFSWLLITPRLHWSHHSPRIARTNSNYGSLLSLWDRAFGTLTPPLPDAQPFGLQALTGSRWHSAWGMLVTPWRARRIRSL
ncbi:MAG: sterol desaturase family protein [Proteobacteria bacterium]|nr:sterol desaturase family protein [Pseudomonadota bacterium]